MSLKQEIMNYKEHEAPECPICGAEPKMNYKVKEGEKIVLWYQCKCGSVFHTGKVDKSFFTEEYKAKWLNMKEIKERMEYEVDVYFPFIETLIEGRKFLDVGFTIDLGLSYLQARGWIATGIDIIKNKYITEDFEQFEFNDKFSCIKFGHVLESFEKPIEAFNRAVGLLEDDGVLIITTPAPEIISYLNPINFGHLSEHKSRHTFISRKEIERLAIKNNMEIVLYRQNLHPRFASFNDAHIILQKR